jgi:hypothetical protein
MLHITNGDSAAEGIRQAGLPGSMLAWRDVLHEGPVPADLSLHELSAVRAGFIAGEGWAPADEAATGFAERDATLARFTEHDEVCLWFEHDLYDQLQCLQILDWLAGERAGDTVLSMVCIGQFPGVERFYGLGQLSPAQLASLYPNRRPITREQLDLARSAWAAFRAAEPSALIALVKGDSTSALPFLHAALLRHLAEFPALEHGLSRTEHYTLERLAAGPVDPFAAFQTVQEREEAPYLGDTIFWGRVYTLATGRHPLVLVRSEGQPLTPPRTLPSLHDSSPKALTLELSEDGQAVLAGRADQVHLNGIDRWLGGVHLSGQEAAWRWDTAQQSVRPAAV